MDRNFGGVIWTDHALSRLAQRGIQQGDAWATWRSPDQSRKGVALNSWVYYRTFGSEKIEVVAKQNERKEWIILSVWSKEVFGNEKPVQKSSFWKNLVKILFSQKSS
ncbi:MAG: DUF4258 domain-containing protein [Patescibacteria group bacterium]